MPKHLHLQHTQVMLHKNTNIKSHKLSTVHTRVTAHTHTLTHTSKCVRVCDINNLVEFEIYSSCFSFVLFFKFFLFFFFPFSVIFSCWHKLSAIIINNNDFCGALPLLKYGAQCAIQKKMRTNTLAHNSTHNRTEKLNNNWSLSSSWKLTSRQPHRVTSDRNRLNKARGGCYPPVPPGNIPTSCLQDLLQEGVLLSPHHQRIEQPSARASNSALGGSK